MVTAAGKVGRFTKPEAQAALYAMYDAWVAETWPAGHREVDVETRFGTTHVRSTGAGDDDATPLVLLHPNSGSSVSWGRLPRLVDGSRPAIAVDIIGTAGRSVQTKPVSEQAQLGPWLDDVLDGLGVQAAHLIGYSEGGWVAACAAAHASSPQRLRSLTLIEPDGGLVPVRERVLFGAVGRGIGVVVGAGDRIARLRRLNEWLSPGVAMTDTEIAFALAVFKGFRPALPAHKTLSDEELSRISAPTLLMLAGQTILFDTEQVAARARQSLHHVEVDITPDAGHGLPFQYPDQVTEKVLAFIGRVDRLR